jgi:membrane protease YdiL (CAAX protease family)
MTADTPEEGVVDAEPKRPLFRFGSQQHRMEAVTHSLLLVLVAFLVGGVLSVAAEGLLGSIGLTEESAPVVVSLSTMSVHFVGFLFVCVWYVQFRESDPLVGVSRPSWRDGLVILGGFVALVVALTGLEALFAQFGLEPAENVATGPGENDPLYFLYVIPIVIFLNAPAEEFLFRGLVQGQFRRAYGVVPGIVASAAVFGLIHYLALIGTGSRLVYVSIAAVAGLLLGGVYEYTENLLVPTAVHALWNVLTYLLLYLQAT